VPARRRPPVVSPFARYDPKSFHVYRARVDDQLSLGNNTWEYVTETRSIETEDDDQYQCFALVTEARASGDQVVLLGFREDEEVVRYNVSTQHSDYGAISPVQWTYVGWDGSQWRYGVGLQIASDADPHLRL
jgi:hypothetical protein